MIPQFAFLLSCCMLHKSYEYMDIKLLHTFPQYGRLDSENKVYVIKNILKSIYLTVICIASFYFLIPSVIFDKWDNTILQTFASLYVSNDIVGLQRVTKLHRSTRLHHTTAVIFLLGAWTADFQRSKTAKMLAVYTIFSAMSFSVNLYLGLRFLLDVSGRNMRALKQLAKICYIVCCVLNWCFQCYMSLNNNEYQLWAYLTGLVFIVWDDIILLKWFLK